MAWPGGEGSGRSVHGPGRPGPGPGPGPLQGPGEGRPGAPLSPCCPAQLPAQQPPAAPVAARGPPGPSQRRDDPCWPEQRRLPSPAPPSHSALSTLGLGAPREFVGDLEEQPESQALPRCGDQASLLSALPLLGPWRPHSGVRPPAGRLTAGGNGP